MPLPLNVCAIEVPELVEVPFTVPLAVTAVGVVKDVVPAAFVQ